ncbi:putative alpha-1,2-mannosidase [Sedimentisphaera cyanobacteriorum]|uniref:Putative alpha-1,2-mannosidase n=1 Tax=Sedimentisphaera cyanobacteriorum TaxID=1940790 RepID=A0A1Q2HN14_9BACT|nr:GH92 family glycosyl hydrolase [Sedimentisphaera cyanobacteriorum]AQQ08867.1 putative alpha-1,2-mannosidase [Sedimentisphaera cyanobacteriorum]
MKFKNLILILITAAISSVLFADDMKHQPLDYVNPLVGSDSAFEFSNGNTYPAIALPWGMNFWTPVTNTDQLNGWCYNYDDYKICGFKQTHQPSPWISDYARFALMPVVGELKVRTEERASWFSHKAETVKPHYYKAYLADYDVTAEITPSQRAAQFRFTFPESDKSYVLLDAFNQGSYVKILPEKRMIIGYCRNNSGGVPDNFHNYFAAVFDKDFEEVSTWSDWKIKKGSSEKKGEHVGAAVRFKTGKGEKVNVKVASSFISLKQAKLNLKREIGNETFSQTRSKAKDIWNKQLNRIRVNGGTEKQYGNFYTALYRTLLFPRKFYEFNEDGKMVHYSPYNGKVLPGYMFTDNGFWDTFRAVFPFFTVMYPELNADIMKGLVNTYKQSGWLPEWASPGHRDCMVGSNSASIIANTYLSGIRGYDIETLYEAILKNSENQHPKLSSVGRLGVDYYNEKGYIPCDVGVNESIARTLEYSYADYTVWKLAEALDKPEEHIKRFRKRAQYYRNVFDKSTNFMRGKKEDGKWQSPFVPEKWGGVFTEGSAWHYTWSVFQDPKGLMNLMGGKKAFAEKLDSVFTTPPKYDASYYGFPIHEIIEMTVVDMGQYAHGNQPIQHMIYLYNYAGQPWKAQKWVREVMDRLYQPRPDGLCGDEDNGQTSAWYVFSALGFYPVCPGSGEFVIGSPIFKEAEMKLENGNIFTVEAEENSKDNIYIQSARLNGRPYSKTYLNYEDIQKGGTISFDMDDEPNKDWGNAPSDAPYSMSEELE